MNIFWFRRDLRLENNCGLYHALLKGPVQPIFIFDNDILESLSKDDARIAFIYSQLQKLNNSLRKVGASVKIYKGKPLEIFKEIIERFNNIQGVYANEDYEPYSINRDKEIEKFLTTRNIPFYTFKDQVIFAKDEVLRNDKTPYTIFTPYKNKWLKLFSAQKISHYPSENLLDNFVKAKLPFPSIEELGFELSKIRVRDINYDAIEDYDKYRDFPCLEHTTYAGPHLRFGTISIRKLVSLAQEKNATYLSELIWREFFMQILYHFPKVTEYCFREEFENIRWLNSEEDFERWKIGKTGYPLIDAGMRELNSTGYMHNRVRMLCASFLTKHLLIDWRWGERYFAEKLLDFELASNVGNWQWAASTGLDSSPYIRIFNPHEQIRKFDKDWKYIRKWLPEVDTPDYPKPIVEHKFARIRALVAFRKATQSALRE